MKIMRHLFVLLCFSSAVFAQGTTLFNRSLAGYLITPEMIFQAYIDDQMAKRSPVPPIWINSHQVRKILYEQLKSDFRRLSYADIEVFVESIEDKLAKLTSEEQKSLVETWLKRKPMAGIYKIEEAEKTRDFVDPRYVY
ncbi:MAG: hypothetical protein OSB62_02825 [Alphaproteobacteria bacterium]|nr:hypothetical protein [Alphaproteobacteria bacterium]